VGGGRLGLRCAAHSSKLCVVTGEGNWFSSAMLRDPAPLVNLRNLRPRR